MHTDPDHNKLDSDLYDADIKAVDIDDDDNEMQLEFGRWRQAQYDEEVEYAAKAMHDSYDELLHEWQW
jgi:hypothetical protein